MTDDAISGRILVQMQHLLLQLCGQPEIVGIQESDEFAGSQLQTTICLLYTSDAADE